MTKEEKIKLLESDLKDCRDPKLLEKYPHLASSILISELEARLKEVRAS